MTPAEEEVYVWARWVCVTSCPYGEIILSNSGSPVPFDNMHEAFLFTKQRESEIERRKIGITFMEELIDMAVTVDEIQAANDMFSREQAALADLRRGWKE